MQFLRNFVVNIFASVETLNGKFHLKESFVISGSDSTKKLAVKSCKFVLKTMLENDRVSSLVPPQMRNSNLSFLNPSEITA